MRQSKEVILSALLSVLLVLLVQRPSLAADLSPRSLASLWSPRFSPDGRRLAVVVSRSPSGDRAASRSLLLIDRGSRRVVQAVIGVAGLDSPLWSPDGRTIGFLANDASGRPQVFELRPGHGRPHQATHATQGLQQFVWRPGTDEIIYSAFEPPEEPAGRGQPIGNDRFVLGSPARSARLWIAAADGAGRPRSFEIGPGTVAEAFPPSLLLPPLAVSPDGKRLAWTRAEAPTSASVFQCGVELLDLTSGRSRPLTGAADGTMNRAFSPDGTRLSIWSGDGLAVMPVPPVSTTRGDAGHAGQARPQALTPTLDRDVATAWWLEGSRAMVVAAIDGDTVSLWTQPIGGRPEKLRLGEVTPVPFIARDGLPAYLGVDGTTGPHGEIAFVGTTATRGAELYVMDSASTLPVRVTDVNAASERWPVVEQETLQWATDHADGTPDGMHADGIATLPPGGANREARPLLVMVHGGPGWAATRAFDAEVRHFADQGWIVFEPNYRGSDNLGGTFEGAINGDAIAGPARDVMTGLAALRARGIRWSGRPALYGISYGGTVVAGLLGLYPKEWSAGVIGWGILDFADEFTQSDSPWLPEFWFGFAPDTSAHQEAYAAQSPVTYAARVEAPTLLLANTGDERAPFIESERFWRTLRLRGTATSLIAYPVAGHGPAHDPEDLRDEDERILDWLARYLDGSRHGRAVGHG